MPGVMGVFEGRSVVVAGAVVGVVVPVVPISHLCSLEQCMQGGCQRRLSGVVGETFMGNVAGLGKTHSPPSPASSAKKRRLASWS